MDVQTEGEDSYPATYKPSEWTPIIRVYKGGQPSPETQVVPSQSVPVSAKPTASAVGAPADAAPASFKPSYHAQQHLRAAHAVALRGKQLPLLPPGTIRVVFRPRGGLALNGAMAQPLMRALQVTAAGRDLGELHLRIHPTNNTFTVATAHETTALHLVQLKQLVLQTTTYPVAAYIAPLPSAVRGVISQAYWEETSEQMLQDLQTRNPDADIIAARRMGRTLSILITFAHGPVPHTIRYMSVVHMYKGSLDACTNCRRPGHRYDVCPNPKSGLCSRCGDKHERQDVPSCIPSCILCGGQHLTGTGSCKARNPTAKRHSPPLQKTKFFTKEDFPPLDKSYPSTSAWSSGATRPNGTTSHDSEVKALREEVKQLRAALSTSSPTLPQISPPRSLPTLSDQPPQKKRRPDESPAQPIDLEAKFQGLAKNLEARFTERITAQSAVQLAASNPLLIIGDFNCAHVDWGYRRTNHRGTVLYNEALKLQLTIFNDFSLPTRIGNSVTADTSPDLTLGRNIVDLQWERTQTTLGSDHHLIRIAVNYQRPRRKFNVRHVEWEQLRKFRQAWPTQAPFDFDSWVRQLQDIRQHTQTLDTTPKIPVINTKNEASASTSRNRRHTEQAAEKTIASSRAAANSSRAFPHSLEERALSPMVAARRDAGNSNPCEPPQS
ncbi:hypothetical protein HPB52_002259 [Rhipicephalus sanguineus]|uniref:Endonuclease/exonuclease/phosphatase domain-containing protein n=1 Tax=Rhipicephalus sanguineus TaxID=34632 RepID=A0A9D4T8A9_RHISA|nr:hypothetical protein HPB52_002259 [Rhipicephalus sanguineus]